MAKNSPVNNWVVRHTPNSEPKFQKNLILIGVGKRKRERVKILTTPFALWKVFNASYNNVPSNCC